MRLWMSFKIMLIAVCVVMFGIASHAQATPPVYTEPTMNAMLDILFANGYIDPNDPQQLLDYVRGKDCTLYQRYYTNDFAWNKIKLRIAGETKVLQKDIATHFILHEEVYLSRYNFKTKSFDIVSDSQIKNINQITLFNNGTFTCNNQPVAYPDTVIPISYDLRLDVPLSLYRLPMAEAMARRILPDIINAGSISTVITGSTAQKRIVYATIYLTVDGVMGITNRGGVLGGHLDKIEFFLDPDRTQRIKRFLYSAT